MHHSRHASRLVPKDPLIVYHAPCTDGFTAAWAATQVDAWANAELLPAAYGDAPPEVEDRDVLIVDYAYPREVLDKLYDSARGLTVLDHHLSAKRALADFPTAVFDMKRSGAGLTWDVWVERPRVPLVNYVEDRDLWKSVLPWTTEINAWLFMQEQTLERWTTISRMDLFEVVDLGSMLVRSRDRYAQDLVEGQCRKLSDMVAVVNAPRWAISDVLHLALQYAGVPVAVGWTQTADGRYQYSVRGDGTYDCSEYAGRFGGGGHHDAAGWTSTERVADEDLGQVAQRLQHPV